MTPAPPASSLNGPDVLGAPGGPAVLRVLTWNVWWRFGDWAARREAIATVLREVRPDVIGLQEVWGAGEGNLAAWLTERLSRASGGRWHWAWAASELPDRWREQLEDSAGPGGPDTAAGLDVGNAVLSRWPILDHEALRLPVPAGGRDDGRLALYALIDAPGARVPFFTAHLNAAACESAVRVAQVTALAEFVAGRRDPPPSGPGGFPPVVTGDFNAPPESDELRLFGGRLTAPVVPGQVLLDAWSYADPAAPAATWDRANPHAAESLEPSSRIDYIHVGVPGRGGLGGVRAVRRAGDAPIDGVWPSDHAAVVADLTLRPRPADVSPAARVTD